MPQNMVGAGGLIMANYMAKVVPRDGTTFAIVPNTFPTMHAVGLPGVQFDTTAFGWIGSMTPVVETMVAWRTTGVTTDEHARAKEIVVGANGREAMTYIFPAPMYEIAGARFKIVLGYQGGNDINLAMERGEVGDRNGTWSNGKNITSERVRDRDIAVLAFAGPDPGDLPTVPTVAALARNSDDRSLAKLLVEASAEIGHPFAAPPDLPHDRLQALRGAFLSTMRDPEFLADAQSLKIESAPVDGESSARIVREVLSMPPQVKARGKLMLQ